MKINSIPRIPSGATSLVWKLAKVVSVTTDKGKEDKVQCEICKKHFSYSGSSTTNIGNHLTKKHVTEWNQVMEKEKKSQPLIAEFQVTKYASDFPKYTEITEKLTNSIIKYFLPIGIVYSPNFKELLHSLNPKYVVPGVEHFKKLILKQYEEKKVLFIFYFILFYYFYFYLFIILFFLFFFIFYFIFYFIFFIIFFIILFLFILL